MKKRRDYTRHITEGDWYPLLGWTYEACCDCHLVHRQQFRIHKGQLQFRSFRDDKRTRALRKRAKILVIRG